MRAFWISVRMTIVLTVLTGIIYPLAMTAAAKVIFPWQAGGSLVENGGKVVGSALIGQNFSKPQYFHPRPSAAGDKGYDASNSGGSNLGPTNKVLIDTVRKRIQEVIANNPGVTAGEIPVGMVTASASGLDPEISPAGAEVQIPRVARARGLSEDRVGELVRQNTRSRWMGIFGEPGVNVLRLNLDLDRIRTARSAGGSP
ncbi:MAG: potassium-transporting ATPase subunit KdpC [Candidatus Binataceae bacterium]